MGKLLEGLLWGWHVLALILAVGIQYSFSTGFFQIRKAGFWLKTACVGSGSTQKRLPPKPPVQSRLKDVEKASRKKMEKQAVLEKTTSRFQALTAALGGSIGTGNIVGVAAAITAGGPGAIFWMWISALLGMMTLFGENVLARIYKNAPGALGYIERVKRIGKPLAVMYAAGCFLASLGMGNMIQTNAAAAALSIFGIPKVVSAAGMAMVLLFVARGGLRAAVKITEKLVPLMTLLFMALSIWVLVVNRGKVIPALSLIAKEAFSLKAGAGGAAGMLIAAKAGISRGIFTNEAGLGSSAFAYEDVADQSPIQMGCMGIFQVFIDTIVMCTLTGLCILCSGASGFSGAQLTFFAYESALGNIGSRAVSLCTALFAFATTVTWCCYGRAGLFYLTKDRGRSSFALLFAGAAFLGCILPLPQVLQLGDAFNGLMAIPNVLALFYYVGEVRDSTVKKL